MLQRGWAWVSGEEEVCPGAIQSSGVCSAPNTPSNISVSSPSWEEFFLHSDWVKRRMYGIEKFLGLS
jgi:hypothetical protein